MSDYDDARDMLLQQGNDNPQKLLDLIERIARRVRKEERDGWAPILPAKVAAPGSFIGIASRKAIIEKSIKESALETEPFSYPTPFEQGLQKLVDRRVAVAVQRREVATDGPLREALRIEYDRGRRQAADDLQDAGEALRAEGRRAGRAEMLKEVRESRRALGVDFDRWLLSEPKP